jgi:hypothetical protein
MKKRRMAICFVLATLIILVGCGGAAKYPNYYTLQIQPPGGSAGAGGCRQLIGGT